MRTSVSSEGDALGTRRLTEKKQESGVTKGALCLHRNCQKLTPYLLCVTKKFQLATATTDTTTARKLP